MNLVGANKLRQMSVAPAPLRAILPHTCRETQTLVQRNIPEMFSH